MFEAAEIGAKVAEPDYEAALPELRTNLINAQFDLAKADFPVLLLIAGDDRVGCNEVLNILHEWMDARYLRTSVFGPMNGGRRAAATLLAALARAARARGNRHLRRLVGDRADRLEAPRRDRRRAVRPVLRSPARSREAAGRRRRPRAQVLDPPSQARARTAREEGRQAQGPSELADREGRPPHSRAL